MAGQLADALAAAHAAKRIIRRDNKPVTVLRNSFDEFFEGALLLLPQQFPNSGHILSQC